MLLERPQDTESVIDPRDAAETPDDPAQVVTPSAQDRRVAAQVWAALSPSARGRPGGGDRGADRGGPGRAPGGRGRDGGS